MDLRCHTIARLFQRRRLDVLMLGLNNSGKTTILYRILSGERFHVTPTFGFNMEAIAFKDIELDVMDVGGGAKMVPLWKHYLINATAIVYVLDCCDAARMEENKTLVTELLSRPERKGCPLLVIVNKSDKASYRVKADDIELRLDLKHLCGLRKYKVYVTSASSGDSLVEAFTWLCAVLGSSHASKIFKKMNQKEEESNNERGLHQDPSAINPHLNQRDITIVTDGEDGRLGESGSDSNNSSMQDRVFRFSESFLKINHFFESRASQMEEMLCRASIDSHTSSSSVPLQRRNHFNFDPDIWVDTISAEPYSPVSPRRKDSMERRTEILNMHHKIMNRCPANTVDTKVNNLPLAQIPSNECKWEKTLKCLGKNLSSEDFNNIDTRQTCHLDTWQTADIGERFLSRSSQVISKRPKEHACADDKQSKIKDVVQNQTRITSPLKTIKETLNNNNSSPQTQLSKQMNTSHYLAEDTSRHFSIYTVFSAIRFALTGWRKSNDPPSHCISSETKSGKVIVKASELTNEPFLVQVNQ